MARDEWETLKRRVQLLARLEGEPLVLAEGLYLVVLARITDPAKVLAAQGTLDLATLRAAAVLAKPAVEATPMFRAAAARELKALENESNAPLLKEHRRALARYGTVDAAWIEGKRAKLAALAATETPADAWQATLALVRLLHGFESAEQLDVTRMALTALGAERRRLALAKVRAAGRAAVMATLPSPDRARANVHALLGHYGLLFPVGEDGVPRLDQASVDRALERKAMTSDLAGAKLTLAQAMGLVELDVATGVRRRLGALVADGLEMDVVRRSVDEKFVNHLIVASTARAARAFAVWGSRLVPHYAKLGITLTLSPRLFANLPKNEELAMLAVCLMEHPDAGDPVALLDATLGLFDKLPRQAAGILARLRTVEAGAGRRAHPAFGAWLDDDALLDRYVHVARVAGQTNIFTKLLLEDFDLAEKTARERAHLSALPKLERLQKTRLEFLERSARSQGDAPRARTKRRIGERIDALLPGAYRREMDACFRAIVKDAWGISVPKLTPAWRDAVRFWLTVDDNHDLLGRLLTMAAGAPGHDVKRLFPRNVAWLAKAKFDVEAWTRARREEISAGGKAYVLSVEEDPLEVLRMGIPFGTCLALEDGCNAASTVLNAIDANKRVIYVRTRDGAIVARKLIAIGKDGKLLGYHFYVSVTGEIERALRDATNRVCAEIAAACGVERGREGEPENLHDGFWYDDGAVAFEDDVVVAAFCASLGLDPPASALEFLESEARADAAMKAGDVEKATMTLVPDFDGPSNHEVGRWVVEHLGAQLAARRAKRDPSLAWHFLVHLGQRGEEGARRALLACTRYGEVRPRMAMRRVLDSYPRSARLATAVADMAARAVRGNVVPGDNGLAHMTFRSVPRLFTGAENAFDALDRCDAAWSAIVEAHPGCDGCRDHAIVEAAGVLSALCTESDDAILTGCLTDRRRSASSHRVALAVLARREVAGAEKALARLRVTRPDFARVPDMIAARLRHGDAAASLPLPDRWPHESLGPLLFSRPGVERLVAGFVPDGATLSATWTPLPWVAAWFRRRPAKKLQDTLFDVAAHAPSSATYAHEKLAILGDVDHLAELARMPVPRRPPASPPAVRPWSVTECMGIAMSVVDQVTAADEGSMPMQLSRSDVIDRRFFDVALEAVRGGDRGLALDAVVAGAASTRVAWSALVAELARTGDAELVARLLGAAVPPATYEPDHIAAIDRLDGARAALGLALGKGATVAWSGLVWAAERAGASDHLFDHVASAMIEASSAMIAAETDTVDQLRTVIDLAVRRAPADKAALVYGNLLDERAAAMFLAAAKKVPRDRLAALRDAVSKAPLGGPRYEARKTWILGSSASTSRA